MGKNRGENKRSAADTSARTIIKDYRLDIALTRLLLPPTTVKTTKTHTLLFAMTTKSILSAVFFVAALMIECSSAFAPSSSSSSVIRESSLSMAPRFDKTSGKWFTDIPEEMEGSSYGPIGTLYRAGPKPFFTRLFNPDTYDQG